MTLFSGCNLSDSHQIRVGFCGDDDGLKCFDYIYILSWSSGGEAHALDHRVENHQGKRAKIMPAQMCRAALDASNRCNGCIRASVATRRGKATCQVSNWTLVFIARLDIFQPDVLQSEPDTANQERPARAPDVRGDDPTAGYRRADCVNDMPKIGLPDKLERIFDMIGNG